MSNYDQYFSDIQKKQAIAWLESKWKENRNCDFCGQNQWSLSQDFVTPPVFEKGIKIGGKAYPQLMLICNNCGNTKYFNAVIMGLIKEEKITEGSHEQ